jgi:hypothetical protein
MTAATDLKAQFMGCGRQDITPSCTIGVSSSLILAS